MDWTRPIDAYCERLGPGLIAEPFNALTNAAFLITALAAFAEWNRAGGRDWPGLALIGLVAVIGVGSALFHSFANVWSSFADVAPIALFVHGYLLLALRRFLALGWGATTAAFLAFIAVEAFVAPGLQPLIGSSTAYVPPLLALLATGAALRLRSHPAAGAVLLASLVFAISLAVRTADGPLCAAFPAGTHMFWHLLNAVTLWLLTNAAVRNR